MNLSLFFSFILVTLVQRYETANILAIFPFPIKSHFMMFNPIVNKLVERGHNLDVMSHFPLKEPMPGYTDLSIKGSMPLLDSNVSIGMLKPKGVINDMLFIFRFGGMQMCDQVLRTETARTLKNSTKKYDLLIYHMMPSDCMHAFAGIFKIPIIDISTTVNQPWASDIIGIPDNPAYIPHNYSGLGTKMSLWERLWNTIELMMYKIGFDYFQEEANRIVRKHLGDGIPHLKEIEKNISLVVTNTHFSIQQPRPAVPNFVEIAGIHIDGKLSLPDHLSTLLNKSSQGVIYMSFGSMLMTESLPETTLKAIFATFKKLPHQILWKANRDLFPKHLDIPPNIHFEKWMPQLGILCHPNTKLFISHGGMFGTQEANYCGVPILGVPIFADQSLNIKTLSAKGLGLHVAFDKITEETFWDSVATSLGSAYKERAEYISKIYRDRPLSPLDTAIYWIEYVIRHKGAYHLKSYGAELTWYQYYLVDVACICFAVVFCFFAVLCFTCKFLYTITKGSQAQKLKSQ